jgi:hypothetical protein
MLVRAIWRRVRLLKPEFVNWGGPGLGWTVAALQVPTQWSFPWALLTPDPASAGGVIDRPDTTNAAVVIRVDFLIILKTSFSPGIGAISP